VARGVSPDIKPKLSSSNPQEKSCSIESRGEAGVSSSELTKVAFSGSDMGIKLGGGVASSFEMTRLLAVAYKPTSLHHVLLYPQSSVVYQLFFLTKNSRLSLEPLIERASKQ